MSQPNKSRLLEQVIAQLQLLGGDTLVRSPCLLDGETSHVKREVDAALLVGLGASELLMVVEVRDRVRVQGVDWVEQLISKRDDVGADVLVAVSSSGFTPAAICLGEAHRLRMWGVNRLSRADLLDLWDFESELGEVAEIERFQINPIIRKDDLAEFEKLGQPITLVRGDGTKDLQLPELIMSLPMKTREEASVRLDRDRTRMRCIIRLPRTNGYCLKLQSSDASINVAGVLVDVVSVAPSRFEFRAAWHYVRSDGLAAVYVECEHPVLGASPILKQVGGEPEWDATFYTTGRPFIPLGDKDNDLLLESRGNRGSLMVDRDGKHRFIAESEWAAANSAVSTEEWAGNELIIVGDVSE